MREYEPRDRRSLELENQREIQRIQKELTIFGKSEAANEKRDKNDPDFVPNLTYERGGSRQQAKTDKTSSKFEIKTFQPKLEELSDFAKFIEKIEAEGAHKAGIAKVSVLFSGLFVRLTL